VNELSVPERFVVSLEDNYRIKTKLLNCRDDLEHTYVVVNGKLCSLYLGMEFLPLVGIPLGGQK
jgi:hypothetical protein